jgi:hypothetical protein
MSRLFPPISEQEGRVLQLTVKQLRGQLRAALNQSKPIRLWRGRAVVAYVVPHQCDWWANANESKAARRKALARFRKLFGD